jgi:hypothetical protein
MAEHLLLYMIELHKSNREKAEIDIVYFLTCLKYYTDKGWARARTFASMCGFISI